MTSRLPKQLLIISVDRYNITHKAHDIPDDTTNIFELYTHAVELKWVTNLIKGVFFFMHMGKILKSTREINELSNDIILFKCQKLNTTSPSGFFSGSDIVENIASLLGPSLFSSSNNSNASNYLNSNVVPVSSSNPSASRRFTLTAQDRAITPTSNLSHSTSSIVSTLSNNNTSYATTILPTIGEDPYNDVLNDQSITYSVVNPGAASLSSLTDELFEISQSSVNNVGDNTSDNDNNNTINNSEESININVPLFTVSVNTDYDNRSDNEPNNENDDASESNYAVTLDDTTVPDNITVPDTTTLSDNTITSETTTVSDTSLSVNDPNLASQLLNIFGNVNTGLNYEDIREQYIDQFNHMNDIGFNDYTKIITALYVSNGDIESAINYYLSY